MQLVKIDLLSLTKLAVGKIVLAKAYYVLEEATKSISTKSFNETKVNTPCRLICVNSLIIL